MNFVTILEQIGTVVDEIQGSSHKKLINLLHLLISMALGIIYLRLHRWNIIHLFLG